MGRKNIKVPEDLFLALRDDKDDQQSWPHYLEQECLLDDRDDEIPPGILELQEATEAELSDIKGRLDDMQTSMPRKIAEALRE